MEEWKDVFGWNGRYQCSNYGRVRCLYKSGKVKILKWIRSRKGYYEVRLQYKGKYQRWDVHRLVAFTFFRKVQKNEECHHKNQMKCCNCVFNIQIKNTHEHRKDHAYQLKDKGKFISKKGRKGRVWTQQERQQQSVKMKGHKGHVWTEEQKRKRSLAYTGKKRGSYKKRDVE